jgi:hypothetical protein
MTNRVYPVGYSAGGSSEYIAGLMAQPAMLLIDSRLKPYSWREEWKQEALQVKYGERYRVAGKFLGNLNYRGGEIKIADLATGLKGLQRYLDEGYDLVILCECCNWSTCHRKVIIEALQEVRPSVEVIQPPKPELVKVEQSALFEVPEKSYWRDI